MGLDHINTKYANSYNNNNNNMWSREGENTVICCDGETIRETILLVLKFNIFIGKLSHYLQGPLQFQSKVANKCGASHLHTKRSM
jgi:hypothetical protein